MKTFEELWASGIREQLEMLEVERLAVRAKCLRAIGLGLAAEVAIVAVIVSLGVDLQFAFFGLLLVLVVGFAWVQGDVGRFKHAFKHEIVGRVVAAIDGGLSFEPERSIQRETYAASRLFLREPDRFRGEDYVAGTLDATAVRFSELHTEYRTTTTDRKGNRRDRWHTIFKGVFFVADFNKHFARNTIVLPDSAERLLGRFGKMLQRATIRREQLVTLEDPAFERHFVVYADDETEARYILTPAMMSRLVAFREKSSRIYVSFAGSHVHVAVSSSRNLFEPRLFSTLVTPELIREYYDDVRFFTEIVDELNLNTRIWTKS